MVEPGSDRCAPGEHDLQFDHAEANWHRDGLEAVVWVACHNDGCDAYFEGHGALHVSDDEAVDYPRTVTEEAAAIYDEPREPLDDTPTKDGGA